ncbi:MAG: carbohydrate ABC transporter permease [Anaerolineae bacterium]|nr:carbohydrate ABC transporter permease [Anaerolineae bacterium]
MTSAKGIFGANRRPAGFTESRKKSSRGFYAVAALTVIVSFFPTVWLFLTSIKEEADIYAWPVVYLPQPATLENYVNIATETPELLRFILNSAIVATTTTVVILACGGLAGYSLGRLTYRGRNLILILILAMSMFPPLALLPSLFSMFLDLRLINTYPGLIIGHTGLYLPIAIWILSNFFQTVPREIEDAARVDGASSLRIFWSIILPLSVPGLISTGLIVFVFSWNEFPLSLVLMSDNFMRTAPVGISLFPGEYSFPWEIISAATVLTILPILVISGVFQDRLIGGLTAGSGK